ncbi:uncharacterized protein HKW66_Vig0103050 [Vigna angularis]|uniref:Uncharacterized protein n=1 Tax=Phaseolus angularis TaxID=3914 RepID=A0A8T0KLB8_PHAAN|nr:uncharacterized protein HKW66_Vig0103050 [Vigna angularis]
MYVCRAGLGWAGENLASFDWEAPCTVYRIVLSVTTGLLGACNPRIGARIIALVCGPCTEGPGSVGVAEIKVAVEKTGGLVVLSEI